MRRKGVLCVAFVVLSALLLLPGKVHSAASFPGYFVPILPEIVAPAPLPSVPSGPPMPGETAIMTGGVSDLGSTREAGNTVQVTTMTESAGGVGSSTSLTLLPPYARPPTDTDLALAAPFGGPGYTSAGRPRAGAPGRRYSPARVKAPGTLTGLPGPILTVGPLDGPGRTAGPLSPPAAPPAAAVPPGGTPALPEGTTGTRIE